MNRYQCDVCGKVVERDSEKPVLLSWCVDTQQDTHLILSPPEAL